MGKTCTRRRRRLIIHIAYETDRYFVLHRVRRSRHKQRNVRVSYTLQTRQNQRRRRIHASIYVGLYSETDRQLRQRYSHTLAFRSISAALRTSTVAVSYSGRVTIAAFATKARSTSRTPAAVLRSSRDTNSTDR